MAIIGNLRNVPLFCPLILRGGKAFIKKGLFEIVIKRGSK